MDLAFYVGIQPCGVLVSVLMWYALGAGSSWVSYLAIGLYLPILAGLFAYYYFQPFQVVATDQGVILDRRIGKVWLEWSYIKPAPRAGFLGTFPIIDLQTRTSYFVNTTLGNAITSELDRPGLAKL